MRLKEKTINALYYSRKGGRSSEFGCMRVSRPKTAKTAKMTAVTVVAFTRQAARRPGGGGCCASETSLSKYVLGMGAVSAPTRPHTRPQTIFALVRPPARPPACW